MQEYHARPQTVTTHDTPLVIASDLATAQTLSDAGRPAVVMASFDFSSARQTAALARAGFGSSVLLDAARPDVAMLAALLSHYRVAHVDRCDFDALRWSAVLR